MSAGAPPLLYSIRFPREVTEMLGISGWSCWLAYLFCILSTVLCILYGIAMWNRGIEEGDEAEILRWMKEEREIEEQF
jgi:hypothetical protein